MLPRFTIARRYGLNCRDCVAVRIKAGVVCGALEENGADTIGIFRNSRTYRNRDRAKRVAHQKSITWNPSRLLPPALFDILGDGV
jgi:hypothetical protein